MVAINLAKRQIGSGCGWFWCEATAGRLKQAIEINECWLTVGRGCHVGHSVLNWPLPHGAVEGQLVAETSREVNTGIGRSGLAGKLIILYEVIQCQGLGAHPIGRLGRIRRQ